MHKTRKAHHHKKMSKMHPTDHFSHEHHECYDVTLHGITRWYKHEFESLGWMILAKHKGMTDKITHYKSSLARLKKAIEHRLKYVKDTDHQDDLRIMWNNVNVLIEHAHQDF
jgi:hypothetical protein